MTRRRRLLRRPHPLRPQLRLRPSLSATALQAKLYAAPYKNNKKRISFLVKFDYTFSIISVGINTLSSLYSMSTTTKVSLMTKVKQQATNYAKLVGKQTIIQHAHLTKVSPRIAKMFAVFKHLPEVDAEAEYSITHPETAELTAKICRELPGVTESSQLIDACVGAGGNYLFWVQHFKNVIGFEPNPVYRLAKRNIRNIRQHLALIKHKKYEPTGIKTPNDIVFFDPPWGGPDYKLETNLRLTLDSVPIEDVIMDAPQRYAVLKLPLNYDMSFFEQKLRGERRIIQIVKFFSQQIIVTELIN